MALGRCEEDLYCKITKEEKLKLMKCANELNASVASIIRYLIDEKLDEIQKKNN